MKNIELLYDFLDNYIDKKHISCSTLDVNKQTLFDFVFIGNNIVVKECDIDINYPIIDNIDQVYNTTNTIFHNLNKNIYSNVNFFILDKKTKDIILIRYNSKLNSFDILSFSDLKNEYSLNINSKKYFIRKKLFNIINKSIIELLTHLKNSSDIKNIKDNIIKIDV